MKNVLRHLKHIYDTKYKALLVIPAILLIFSILVISDEYIQTGEFIKKGVSLKGGSTISINDVNVNIVELKSHLSSKFPNLDINVRLLTKTGVQTGIIVESSTQEPTELIKEIEAKTSPLSKDKYTIDTTGPSLGKSFFTQAIFAVLIAFAFMAIVVFISFRDFLPSVYIIYSALADILFALAIFDLFNMKLTTAGIAAFLMLIGYSVDTDILLTTRVLKRKEGTVEERVYNSMSTGLTMTIAAIAATVVAYFATESEVLKQIMFILFWGLIADLANTWLANVGLLRWYLEGKEHRQEQKQD